MKLPILSYGHNILRQKCDDISNDYPDLDKLIENMWETLDNADGCGLAAPQVGKPIRLFIVNSKSTYDNLESDDRAFYFENGDTGIIETFINAKIMDRYGDAWEDEEGCLSIPNMPQKVIRLWNITISYFDRDFKEQIKTFAGSTARVVQHEYDHTEGVLYIDHISPLARRLIEGKLKRISKGQSPATYPMIYKK